MRPIINIKEKFEFRAPILISVARKLELAKIGAVIFPFNVSPRLPGAPLKQIGAPAIKTLEEVYA